MYKILFDIDSPKIATTDWQQNKLFLEFSEQHFHYVITGVSGQLIKLKYYRLDAMTQQELTEVLEEIINNEIYLKEKLKEVIIIYHFPENIFVPGELFDQNQTRSMMELVNGDLKKGTILSERIHGQQIYNVFRVPTGIHNMVQQKFSNGKYWHYYSLHTEAIHKVHSSSEDAVWVSFYTNRIVVVVFGEQQLQLVQSFEYQHAEDVAYYLLSIYEYYKLPVLEIPLFIEGMIDVDSAMYRELEKYFQIINPVKLELAAETGELLENFPGHFFSPLLKLLPCVS